MGYWEAERESLGSPSASRRASDEEPFISGALHLLTARVNFEENQKTHLMAES
jgi:hypothetical protein